MLSAGVDANIVLVVIVNWAFDFLTVISNSSVKAYFYLHEMLCEFVSLVQS